MRSNATAPPKAMVAVEAVVAVPVVVAEATAAGKLDECECGFNTLTCVNRSLVHMR